MDDDLFTQLSVDGIFDPPQPETTCDHCTAVIADGDEFYANDDGNVFCVPCVETE